MFKSNSFFYSGMLVAILFLALFAGNSLFQAVFAGSSGNLPRELSLGMEIGLIDQEHLKSGRLNRSINHQQFAEKIAIALDLLGYENADVKNLSHMGIIAGKGSKSPITRKEAVETLARACAALKAASLISYESSEPSTYKDYRISEKYRSEISYLQKKFVVRGFPDGSLGAGRRLTLKDAVFFIYRFYEAVAADLMGSRDNQGISFVDIPLSHPIMAVIRNLTASGAFDKIILRPSFDGDSFITVADLNEIINGLFARAGKETDQVRMRTILAGQSSDFARRGQLALTLEYILDSFAKDKLKAQKIEYLDVTFENPEYEALVKLAGCGLKLGYGDGRFAAEDNVTWFEATSLLNEVIKFSAIVEEPTTKKDRLAVKDDIENLKTLLKAKREKIRKILKIEEATDQKQAEPETGN